MISKFIAKLQNSVEFMSIGSRAWPGFTFEFFHLSNHENLGSLLKNLKA